MPRLRTDPARPRLRIRPRTFPHQDAEFAAAVDAACRRIRGSDRTLIAERVRDLLAAQYRRVVVQPQDPLAATAEDLVLYIYRDGRPVLALPAPPPAAPVIQRRPMANEPEVSRRLE